MTWSTTELDARWAAVASSPTICGHVVQVCVRPDVGKREFPDTVELCPRRGAVGDRWEKRTWMHLPDGSPDPRVQVALMNSRMLAFLQSLTGCGHHPGDTLMVDFDLGMDHLPAGTRVRVGPAVIEVTDIENDACAKFAVHFGAAVFQWIRATANRERRLRGLFARVITGGSVRAGDDIQKLPA